MAYTYDEFGTQIELLDEEERKRREAAAKAAGETPVAKTETTVYQDGSQTQTTTQEVPAAPVAPVAPEAPPAPQPQAQSRAVAPVAPDQAAYTRQQESSGNYNIGYHYKPDAQGQRRSSAYGPYGFTAAAVQDIARQDSSLNKPITEWTKEDHDRGYAIFSQKNQARLGQLGVEATPGATQLAHLLGADGAARFIKTGEVSDAAANANGGREKLIQIAQGRMAGGQAPASGAVQQPAQQPAPTAPVSPEQAQQRLPGVDYSLGGGGAAGLRMPPAPAPVTGQGLIAPAIQTYQAVQNDMNGLMKLATTDTAPDFIRERAREQFANLYDQQKKLKQAEDSIPKMNPRELADAMNGKNKSGIGDWLQYLLYKHVGLTDLANEKGEQLGIGHKWEQKIITDASNNPMAVQVQTSASGRVLGGNKMDGSPLTPEELGQVGSALGKGTSLSADVYVDKATGQRYRSGYDNAGNAALVNVQGGPVYRGDPKNLTLQSIGTTEAKANIRLQYEPAIAAASKGASTLAEFNAMNGTNYAIAGRDAQGLPLLVDQTSGQLLTRPPATAGAQPAPTAPAVQQPPAPVAAPVSPAELQRQGKIQEAQGQAFVKFENEDLLPRAEAGQTISRVRKEQIKGPDGILNNPEIASLLQGSSGGEVGNIIRDLVTGQFKDQADLSARVAALNLNDRQKAVLYRQIGLNNQIAPLTLRANAGPGAVSDAEQKANRDANVDITRQPLYSGLSLLTKDQFLKDQAQARADFRAQHPEFKSTAEFNTAWNAEKSRLDKQYDNIYAARAAYIAKYNPMDKDGRATNPGAVVDAYKHYPVPEWNSETRSWDFGTEYSKKAARPKLNEFIR